MSAQFQVGTWKQHMTTIASKEWLLLFQESGASTRVVLDCLVLEFHSFEAFLWHLKPGICTVAPFFRFGILRLRPSTNHRTSSVSIAPAHRSSLPAWPLLSIFFFSLISLSLGTQFVSNTSSLSLPSASCAAWNALWMLSSLTRASSSADSSAILKGKH